MTLVEVDNPLTPYIAQARVATTDALASTSAVVKTGVSRWIDFERKAERELCSDTEKGIVSGACTLWTSERDHDREQR